ncbi:MAG: glycosyltransferase [Alphaproteobacteria bacterium]|uniref:Glycosyltransferase n=1 Tax=Candidatus Nitrobium versatile TaxID=2884831 RepID=A0A953JCA1_9BACT|nr:glycosyltransferase [Candidatus Nitrobium versatile]
MIRYSVIVPAFNAAATLDACLQALLAQTADREVYEVIVVDDGSTDRTGERAGKYPVRVVRQENRGPAAARNHGAREAKGEIILFTDSDCVPSPDWIREMIKPFADPAVAAVKGAYRSSQRSLVARFAQVEFEERFEMLKKADSVDMVDTYSAAFRREIFRGEGGFDESFPVANNEDTDLSYKLSAAGHRMVFNPAAIVSHLRHPDSVRRYTKQKFGRGYWRMVVYEKFPEKMVKDTYTPQSLKFQILFLFAVLFFAGLSPLVRPSAWPAAFFFLAYLGATFPFTLFALRRDAAVGVLSPLFLAMRALAIGSGVLYFLGKKYLRRSF